MESREYGEIERLVARSKHPFRPRRFMGRAREKLDPSDILEERVGLSRHAFPDPGVYRHETVVAGDRVAVRWSRRGEACGDMRGYLQNREETPAIHRATIYQMKEGQVTGHWQLSTASDSSSNSDSAVCLASSFKSKVRAVGSNGLKHRSRGCAQN